MPWPIRFLLIGPLLFVPMSRSLAGDLGGSPAAMEEQHEVAVQSDYSFLRRPADVDRLVELGKLVKVEGNRDYSLSKVSYPYARPEVLSFIEHLAAAYREEFGFQLVVTSLTRPTTLQPRNAHKLSVHPAGMAVDLRVPDAKARRTWLEQRLLELEDAGAIQVTRERNPPHYHVAVFAEQYLPIAAREDSLRAIARARADSLERARVRHLAQVEETKRKSTRGTILLAGLATLAVAAPVARRERRRRRR